MRVSILNHSYYKRTLIESRLPLLYFSHIMECFNKKHYISMKESHESIFQEIKIACTANVAKLERTCISFSLHVLRVKGF